MPSKEQLFRVSFHSKKSNHSMFLLVWGVDAMDVLVKMSGIVGPGAEYTLDAMNAYIGENGTPVERPAV